MNQLTIGSGDADRRLDKYLASYLNTAGKNFIYKMLRKKRIKLNGHRAYGNELLAEGDIVTLYMADETLGSFMEEKELTASTDDICVIYEDKNVLIVNKPAGLLTHSEENGDSLIDRALLYLHKKSEYFPSKTSTFTPAACNRLDRNTSGIVLIGKTLPAVQALNMVLRDGYAEKYYITLVKGELNTGAVLKGYHVKNRNENTVSIGSVKELGSDDTAETPIKQVMTQYDVIRTNGKYSLLKVKLITGRSHQIRAHMKSIGHPILGDPKYGDETENRFVRQYGVQYQLLHASEIRLTIDNGVLSYLNGKNFTCEAPRDFETVIKRLFSI